jgi:glycosyltransferase involved in cell wall biosynthesis
MKIAANLLTYPATGCGKSLLYLMQGVRKNFPETQFAVFFNAKRSLVLDLPFPAEKIPYRSNFFGRLLLKKKLSSYNFIHYHWNGNDTVVTPAYKSIAMIHDVLPLLIPDYFRNNRDQDKWRATIQKTLVAAKIILTPSQYSKTEILKNFKVDRQVHVLPHGITASVATNVTERGDYYIYVGGYDQRKGLVQLLESFLNFKIQRKLVFVGEINYFSNSFKSLVETACSRGILTEKGYVSDLELQDLIAHARALIYPSKYEGFGLPPLEAMRLGTPVLTTPFSSMPEVCRDAVLYFDSDLEGALEEILTEFENDKTLAEKLQKAGYENAAKYDWDVTAKKYMEILQGNANEFI